MPRAPPARGLKVIIAGAGGAAHLPGMAASMTRLPVLGVPVESKALSGLDSLLSIVQMPAGVPVGTLAIGKAGAINAGLLAAAILATGDAALAERLDAWRQAPDRRRRRNARMIVPPGSTIGIVGGGQIGPDAGDGGGAARLSLPHLRARRRQRRRREVAADFTQGAFDDEGGARPLRRRGRRRHLRVREYRRPGRSPRSPSWCRCTRRAEALEIAQDRLEEKSFIQRLGGRPAAVRAGRRPRRARRGAWRRSARRPSSRRGASAMTARARCGSTIAGRGRRRLGGGARRALACSKASSASTPNSRSCSAAARMARSSTWPAPRNRHDGGILAASSVPAGAGARRRDRRGARRWPGASPTALDYVGVLALEFFAVGGGADVQRDGAARPQ